MSINSVSNYYATFKGLVKMHQRTITIGYMFHYLVFLLKKNILLNLLSCFLSYKYIIQ